MVSVGPAPAPTTGLPTRGGRPDAVPLSCRISQASDSALTLGARLAGATPDQATAMLSAVGHDSPFSPSADCVSRNMPYQVGVTSCFCAHRNTYEPKARSGC